MSKSKVVIEKIHLVNIRIVSGNVNTDPNITIEHANGFKTEFVVDQSVDPDQNLIRILFTVKLNGIDSAENLIGATADYTFEYIFIVDNLPDIIVLKDEEAMNIEIEHHLAVTLMGIVYSTSRGLVLARTQGTFGSGLLLPVIDPQTLIKVEER